MKVCVYLEFKNFLGGLLFKKIGSGMISSYNNQMAMLNKMGVEVVEKWDGSCDILMTNSPWPRAYFLAWRARKKGKKVVVWAHNTAEDIMSVFWFNKYFFPLAKRYLARFYNLGDVIFAPSAYTKSLLVNYGLNPDKIVVQSNGVNLKDFYPDEAKRQAMRQKFGLHGMAVGMVGLAIPRKGIDTFLYLAKKFPAIDFIWYGKIYNSLMVRPEYKNKLPNVQFTGFVEDINAAFNSLDIFIFPSYEENQGMVIMEAAAVGLPVLVRNIPVYESWLTNRECCLKAKNNEEFVESLKKLTDSEKLRKKLSQDIKKIAQENSLEIVEDQFKKILLELAGNIQK